MHLLFGSPILKNSTDKWLTWSSFWMGDLLKSFSVSVRVRTKHSEKTRVGLLGLIDSA